MTEKDKEAALELINKYPKEIPSLLFGELINISRIYQARIIELCLALEVYIEDIVRRSPEKGHKMKDSMRDMSDVTREYVRGLSDVEIEDFIKASEPLVDQAEQIAKTLLASKTGVPKPKSELN